MELVVVGGAVVIGVGWGLYKTVGEPLVWAFQAAFYAHNRT